MAKCASLLQWGRGLPSAETPETTRKASPLPGFNGAADFHPRKRALHAWSAEKLDIASMGPRTSIRGNTPTTITADECVVGLQWGRGLPSAETELDAHASLEGGMLQWGRGLPSAETWRPQDDVLLVRWLQWGRGLPSAETPALRLADEIGPDASMGPRTSIRGNSMIFAIFWCASFCFNGAADFHPRKPPWPSIPPPGPGPASMGPRTSIRGNALRCSPRSGR